MANLRTELEQTINRMAAERQKHLDAVAEIDATFERFGITLNGSSQKKAAKGAKKGRKAGEGKKAGKAAATATATRKPTAGKKRGRRKQTAEQWVLSKLKGGKDHATGAINAAWKKSGRGGSADNALSKLVKEGKVKRTNIEGARGSQYSLT